MNLINQTKPIYRLSFDRTWNAYSYRYDETPVIKTNESNRTAILERDYQKLLKNQINTVKTIKDNAVLMFDKSSKFPRFKLEQTSYKRCIKEAKADYIVLNIDKSPRAGYIKLWETKDAFYYNYWRGETADLASALNIPVGMITAHGDTRIYTDLTKHQLAYINLLNNQYSKPVILDDDLNKIVDSQNQTLTQDDVDQIMAMLQSSDNETAGLALKLLTNYNVTATPCTVRYMLITTSHNWRWCNAKTSVGVKNMIDTLDLESFSSYFPACLHHCIKQGETCEGVDREMFQKFIIDKTTISLQSYVESTYGTLSRYGIKVDLNITAE